MMIRRVRLKYFKQFKEHQFELTDSIVLAGPNNSGKSTLLQSLSVWNLAIQRWLIEKGRSGAKSRSEANEQLEDTPASREPRATELAESAESNEAAAADDTVQSSRKSSKGRPGVRISRKDFTAIPLRDLNLLWQDRRTAFRKDDGPPGTRPGTHKLIGIHVEGEDDKGEWALPFELRYENTELLYAIPVADNPQHAVANIAERIQIVHIPPFSGIGAEENRMDRPYQDLLIGQGKPGDILRNLLLEVVERNDNSWKELCDHVRDLFGYSLMRPVYDGRPFILCEYQPVSKPKKSEPKFDIASAGSGFHQVLLLLGFFYARPASVLLIDEPDAHQHVILQKQVYDQLRLVARSKKCQLIIATHSEVILRETSFENVMSFYRKPHPLDAKVHRDQVREAMKRLTALDLLLAERSNCFVYTEGGSDLDLLREWAKILEHPLHQLLVNPPWHSNEGRSPHEARAHHFALKAVKENIRGILLLDGDNREDAEDFTEKGTLVVARWTRYEIENYLLVPSALERYPYLVNCSAGKLTIRDSYTLKGNYRRRYWTALLANTSIFVLLLQASRSCRASLMLQVITYPRAISIRSQP